MRRQHSLALHSDRKAVTLTARDQRRADRRRAAQPPKSTKALSFRPAK